MRTIYLDGNDFNTFEEFLAAFCKAADVEYWEKDLFSMHDCFVGGFGLDPPYRIRWENSANSLQLEPIKDSIAQNLQDQYAKDHPEHERLALWIRSFEAGMTPSTCLRIVEIIVSVDGIELELI